MQVVPFRIPEDLVKRLDAHAVRLAKKHQGLRVTRADALRILLTAALDAEEAKRD